MPPPTYAAGVRMPFAQLPTEVRTWVEQTIGAPVTEAVDAVGGFSNGVAAVLQTAMGAFFVKAVSSRPNPVALEFYQREHARLALLPDHPTIVKPVATAHVPTDGAAYFALLFQAVPGRPPSHPWDEPTTSLVFDALQDLKVTLQVAPVPDLPDSSDLAEFLVNWAGIAADPDDPWATLQPSTLARLEAAETAVVTALPGDRAAHIDLRADNILIGAPDADDGRQVWFVDWAHVERAASWVDPALLACDLVLSRADRMHGGTMDIDNFLRRHPLTAAVDPDLHWGMIGALAGALHCASRRPAPPALPTIRGWQAAASDTMLDFALRSRNLGGVRGRW